MTKAENTESIFIRLPPALKRQIEQAAKKDGRKASDWARRTLSEAVGGKR